MSEQSPSSARVGRDLLEATNAFAHESRAKSWFHLITATVLLFSTLLAAALAPWWPVQLLASLVGALLMVRTFIMCHDFMHGTILRGSKLAKVLVYPLATLVLTPPRSWRHSHNFHHGHVGKVVGSDTGSFPILTTEMWEQATPTQRLIYRISRHPLSIAFAYLTVFFFNVCLLTLLKDPRKYWDSGIAIATHAAIITTLSMFGSGSMLLFAFLIPVVVASALGAYLFYAQHNFVGMRIVPPEKWTYGNAALVSSSYMKLGPIMRHFTANIGYHHVHHLNPMIPFYRLPEAMAAIPELHHPVETTLHPRDVLACLRLKLWDPASERMLTFRDARRLATVRV